MSSMQSASLVRLLGLFSVLGPVVYLVAVFVGGLLWPGYSHYSETVSTLTSAGAPNQAVMVPLFALYNVCVILLAAGLFLGVEGKKPFWGSVFLGAAGLGGLVLFFFPRDPMGPPVTFAGTMYIVVASAIAFCSIASMATFCLRLRRVEGWKRLAVFSLVMLLSAIFLGQFGAASINTPYSGLAERLSIGSILFWIEGMAIGLVTHKRA